MSFHVRPSVLEDAKEWYQWFRTGDILKWFPMTTQWEIEDAINISMSYMGQNGVFSIEKEGELCGIANIYINTMEKLKHQALFAIVIKEEFRGQGVGTHLTRHIIHEAKHNLGIKLLHLEVYEGNPAIHLYKKLGFVQYGLHKKFIKDENGEYHAKILMQKKL